MSRTRLSLAACVLGLSIAASAAAQQAEPAEGTAPAESTAPAPSTPPPAYTASSEACLPACRSGYTCVHALCVSACNPACSEGERCNASGECIATAAEASAWAPLRFFAQSSQPDDAPLPPDPSAERHDGVMLRGTLGLGILSDTFDNDDARANTRLELDDHTRLSGFASAFSFDVGGAVAANMVVHARLSAIYAGNPSSSIDGASYDQGRRNYASAIFVGPALSYYFMPANVYVTGALGLSWIAQRYLDSFGTRHTLTAGTGPGVNVDAGKEWWGADQLGLGLGARFWYSRVSDQTAIGHLDYAAIGGALLLSVTYQ